MLELLPSEPTSIENAVDSKAAYSVLQVRGQESPAINRRRAIFFAEMDFFSLPRS